MNRDEFLKKSCIMPFVHLGTKPDGCYRVCCLAPDLELKNQEVPMTPLTHSIESAWNSTAYDEIRKRTLEGPLPECSTCWKLESSGGHSKRMKENKKYEALIDELFNTKDSSDSLSLPMPDYFDLRLGNQCNLKCRMCNPIFSKPIADELEQNDFSQMDPEISNDLGAMLDRAQKMQRWYDDDFFQDLSQMIPGLREVYISGGEPLLVKELNRFLDECIKQQRAKNIKLRLNSNLSVWNEDFFKKLSHFKRVSFGVSIDAFGDRNTWIRHPLKWDVLAKNMDRLLLFSKDLPNFHPTINITVSVYNVLALPELISWIKSKDSKLDFFIDYVEAPNFMAIDWLDDDFKAQARNALLNFVADTPGHQHLNGLIKRLERNQQQDHQIRRTQFLTHTQTLDQWRSQNYLEVFPELSNI